MIQRSTNYGRTSAAKMIYAIFVTAVVIAFFMLMVYMR
jgi:uncharacterized PurR-regulated membrane protein YhhQ (DUF165 family)